MSTLSETVEVRVPAEQLFTWLATLWESGVALGDPRPGAGVLPAARMGRGFRLPCGGRSWGLPLDTELEVRDYAEPEGWRAVSRPDAVFSWTVRIAPVAGGAVLTCVLRHVPAGVVARLRERLAGQRARRRVLRQLLDVWKTDAERQEALGRLRVALDVRGPAPPQRRG